MAKSERNLVCPSCPGIMSLLKGPDFGWPLYCCLQVHLLLELYRLQGNITRVKINELKPLKPRFEVPDVLIAEPPTEPWVCLWSESAQWHSENSRTYAWFIVFLWVTSARLCCLVFASDSPVSLCFSLFSPVSQCCPRMIMALCCLWEQRARGWSLVPIHLGWTSWRGQRCCYPSTLVACWPLSTCVFPRKREYWVFLS